VDKSELFWYEIHFREILHPNRSILTEREIPTITERVATHLSSPVLAPWICRSVSGSPCPRAPKPSRWPPSYHPLDNWGFAAGKANNSFAVMAIQSTGGKQWCKLSRPRRRAALACHKTKQRELELSHRVRGLGRKVQLPFIALLVRVQCRTSRRDKRRLLLPSL
jgi:hypothetical protein